MTLGWYDRRVVPPMLVRGCFSECAGRAHSHLERGHQDRQRHGRRRPCSELPRVHSVKGGPLHTAPNPSLTAVRNRTRWSWHCLLFSSISCRNLCCLNMEYVGLLSLWLRRWGLQFTYHGHLAVSTVCCPACSQLSSFEQHVSNCQLKWLLSICKCQFSMTTNCLWIQPTAL